jgi:hypothetical protein
MEKPQQQSAQTSMQFGVSVHGASFVRLHTSTPVSSAWLCLAAFSTLLHHSTSLDVSDGSCTVVLAERSAELSCTEEHWALGPLCIPAIATLPFLSLCMRVPG